MIPKLRFPEFVGEWKEKRIKDVLKIGSGRDYKHLNPGVIPVYGTGGYMTSVNDYLYDGDSIGIGRKGTIDKPVFLTGKFWTVDTLFYTYSFEETTAKFIYLIFQNINWKKYNEASGVPSLSKATIEKILINIPKLPEQTKIATFLTAVDKRVNLLQKKKAELELYKKGVMQQLFSQAIRFKDDNGNDFPDWQEKKLGEVCKVQGGYAFKSSKFKENGIPVIRISNISNFNNFIDTSNLVYYDKFDNDENYVVRSGGLLIAMSGATTGKTSIFNLEGFAYVNQRVGLFKSISKDLFYQYITQYVLYDDFNNQLSSLLVAGAQPNISSSDIESIKIPFPHKDEQQKIADFLSAIDKSIEKLAAQISDSLLFKQGLLQRMFV